MGKPGLNFVNLPCLRSQFFFGCKTNVMGLFKSHTRVPAFSYVRSYFVCKNVCVVAFVHAHVHVHHTWAHFLEVVSAAKVLRDGDGVVQVEHCVVPPSRHEDRVAGMLHELVDLDRVPVLASYPGKQVHEVIDLSVTPGSIAIEDIKIHPSVAI